MPYNLKPGLLVLGEKLRSRSDVLSSQICRAVGIRRTSAGGHSTSEPASLVPNREAQVAWAFGEQGSCEPAGKATSNNCKRNISLSDLISGK